MNTQLVISCQFTSQISRIFLLRKSISMSTKKYFSVKKMHIGKYVTGFFVLCHFNRSHFRLPAFLTYRQLDLFTKVQDYPFSQDIPKQLKTWLTNQFLDHETVAGICQSWTISNIVLIDSWCGISPSFNHIPIKDSNVFRESWSQLTIRKVLRRVTCQIVQCYFNRSHFQPLAFLTACKFNRRKIEKFDWVQDYSIFFKTFKNN